MQIIILIVLIILRIIIIIVEREFFRNTCVNCMHEAYKRKKSAKLAQDISGVGGVCGRPLAKTPFHLTAELRVGRWCGT